MAIPCRLWNFPSLDKEGWRGAPGWFETAIPQVTQKRHIPTDLRPAQPQRPASVSASLPFAPLNHSWESLCE
jgi:hypothetical protein